MSLAGILFLLFLAQTKKPQSFEGKNFEGKYVEINGIVKSQKKASDYSLLKIGNITIFSEIMQNFTSKNITVTGRMHEDIVIADKIKIED